jgi:hypothetical protein
MQPGLAPRIAHHRTVVADSGRIDNAVGVVVEHHQAIAVPHHKQRMVSAADQILGDDEEHVAPRDAGGLEQLHLGDGIILAVPLPGAQRLGRSRPAVGDLEADCESSMKLTRRLTQLLTRLDLSALIEASRASPTTAAPRTGTAPTTPTPVRAAICRPAACGPTASATLPKTFGLLTSIRRQHQSGLHLRAAGMIETAARRDTHCVQRVRADPDRRSGAATKARQAAKRHRCHKQGRRTVVGPAAGASIATCWTGAGAAAAACCARKLIQLAARTAQNRLGLWSALKPAASAMVAYHSRPGSFARLQARGIRSEPRPKPGTDCLSANSRGRRRKVARCAFVPLGAWTVMLP